MAGGMIEGTQVALAFVGAIVACVVLGWFFGGLFDQLADDLQRILDREEREAEDKLLRDFLDGEGR